MPLGVSIPVIVAPYGSFVIHRNIGRLQALQQCRAECGEGVGEHGVIGGEIHAVYQAKICLTVPFAAGARSSTNSSEP